jgi:hypothetical protein
MFMVIAWIIPVKMECSFIDKKKPIELKKRK